jgi:hypothetical protein
MEKTLLGREPKLKAVHQSMSLCSKRIIIFNSDEGNAIGFRI